jgi:hypothetical protein
MANKDGLALTGLFQDMGSHSISNPRPAGLALVLDFCLMASTKQLNAGNYLAGLNSQTATTFTGTHISPELAQKHFGAYQQGGIMAAGYWAGADLAWSSVTRCFAR